MRKRVLRVLPVAFMLGLLLAIPASTQTWTKSASAEEAVSSLPFLVLVNRLELTTDQMEEMRNILMGIQANQDIQYERIAALEEEMIAFKGSAEELDERLEDFRTESQVQDELARENVAEAMDRLSEILSFKQGEILQGILPRLVGSRQASGTQEMMSRRRMGSTDGESRSTRIRERLEGFLDDEDIETSRGLGVLGRVELRMNRQPSGPAMWGSMSGMLSRKLRANVLDQLIDVLTLKLEAQQ